MTPKNIYVRSAIDFAHDIAAGAFPGAVLAAWLIRRRVEGVSSEALGAVQQASMALWLVMFGALFVIVATGLVRLKYWRLNVRAGYLKTKTDMVVTKHIAFVMLFVLSAIWMYTLLP